jgi:hypothetical protein
MLAMLLREQGEESPPVVTVVRVVNERLLVVTDGKQEFTCELWEAA